MTELPRRLPAHVPRLSPEEIANRGFASAFRGVSEPDVRSFLKRVAEEVAALLQAERDLQAQVAQLTERLRAPAPISEQQLLDALGEETARVLRSAQTAAEDIRTRAEARAADLLREAQERAQRLTEEAEQRARQVREDAEAAAAAHGEAARAAAEARRRELDAEVEHLRAEAVASAAAEIEAAREQGRAMVAEARTVRERVLADLARRRGLLQMQVDELRAGRDRLLDAYRVVKRTLEEAVAALSEVEARAAAERAAAPAVHAPVAPGREAGATEGAGGAAEAAVSREAGGPEAGAGVAEGAAEPEPGPAAAAAVPVPDGAGEVEAGAAGEERDVEALFARLRAASAEPEPAPAAAPVPEPAPSAGPVPEPAPAAGPGRHATPTRKRRAGPEPPGAPPRPPDERDQGGADDPAAAARARRDEALGPLRRELERRAKRALGDDQNEVLDRLRRAKRHDDPATVLPEAAAQQRHFVEVLAPSLVAAYRAGAAFAGGPPGVEVPADLAAGFAEQVLEPLRTAITGILAEADGGDEVRGRISARYRERKGRALTEAVGDAIAGAWARGTYDAAAAGSRLRWVPEVPGRCPDCDDNALEEVRRGDTFPTGVTRPPAHPGCRCFLVVVGRG